MAERFDAFAASDAAMAKSGTVTLELALANVPMVVAYRVSPATAFLVRRMGVSVEHASLVNLLAGRAGGAGVPPGGLHAGAARRRRATTLLSSERGPRQQHQGFTEVVKALGDRTPSPERARRQSRARHRPRRKRLGRRLAPALARPRRAGARAHLRRCSSMLSLIMLATRSASQPAWPSTNGFLPGDDAIEERVDLVGETVLLLDLVGLGGDRRQPVGHRIAAQPVAGDPPLAEIATQILVARKDAHAPLGLVADPAGRDVGDAARFEGDAGIGEVDALAEHRRADGIDLGDRRRRPGR